MIAQEPYDAHNQVWAGGMGGAGTSNSPLADFKNEIEIEGGGATWKICDGERKANINVAKEATLATGAHGDGRRCWTNDSHREFDPRLDRSR